MTKTAALDAWVRGVLLGVLLLLLGAVVATIAGLRK